MIDIVFIIIYIFSPFILIRLLKVAGITLSTISIPSVFFAYYLTTAYIGILFLYYDWNYYSVYGIIDRHMILTVFLYSLSCLFLP